MVRQLPHDPSVNLLSQEQWTPLSVSRESDRLRRYVTPRMRHRDEAVPVAGAGAVPAGALPPVVVDLDNPSHRLLALFRNRGITDPVRNRMAAQGAMLVTEHFSCRTMAECLCRRTCNKYQNLHNVYNTFTRGFLAYIIYCIACGSWSSPIASASPTLELLEGYEDVGLGIADRFGAWLVLTYNYLDEGHTYFTMKVMYNGDDGLRRYNVKVWMDEQQKRLKRGGIYSAAWLANELNHNRRIHKRYTMGMLYQHILLLARITNRMNRILDKRHRWDTITNRQIGTVEDLIDARLYEDYEGA